MKIINDSDLGTCTQHTRPVENGKAPKFPLTGLGISMEHTFALNYMNETP